MSGRDLENIPDADRTLLNAIATEIAVLQLGEHSVVLGIEPLAAFQLAGILQLALRHPDLSEELQLTARGLVDLIHDWFDQGDPDSGRTESPAIALLIRRGNDPGEDLPRQSRIIIP